MVKRKKNGKGSLPASQESDIFQPLEDPSHYETQLKQIDEHILQEELKFFENEQQKTLAPNSTPEDSIPISVDIRELDFKHLAQVHREIKGKLFDVVMMDPPWQLSGANPTRGVTISYEALPDSSIGSMPIHLLQENGLLFIWTINAKYRMTLQLMEKWGYKYIDEVVWVKKTCNNKIAKSHGYWLQHAKETCLVGVIGDLEVSSQEIPDVIFSLRRGQSQKPEEIYEMIEALVPDGSYLEIFGRRNNLRNGWITIGNEI